jgi:D-alanine-D-alanine ligase-like ATP-grasp enzyme
MLIFATQKMGIKKIIQRLTNWELWHFNVLYFPISPVWLWYCLRSRSFWFFSTSNPTITFGGLHGEGKKEMYDQLPPHLYPRTIYILHDLPFKEVKKKVSDAGFNYPFVVKPDVGMKGILFRKIESEEQLMKYHERIPVEYIIQDMITLPVEVSVFYYRYPNEEKGTVSGFIQKELLHVKGDGKSTLEELIRNHPRAKFRYDEMKHRHGHRFDRVIPQDEIFYLSYAGNHNRGAHFINLHNEIDENLQKVFDELSHYNKQFFYGRYDIKATSIEELKQGKNFSILEFNGAGAEPNHIYDCNMSIWKAYGTILKHWKALYRISRYNHKQGVPYWSFQKGRRFIKEANKHFRLLEKFD